MTDGIPKDDMERIIVDSFFRCYNCERQTTFAVEQRRERPDFLLRDKSSGRIVGVEVTLAIFEDSDSLTARKVFNRTDAIMPPDALDVMPRSEIVRRYISGSVNDSVRHNNLELARIVRDRISEKAARFERLDFHYPVLLVVGVGDKVFGLRAMRNALETLQIPAAPPFAETWLSVFCCMTDDNGIHRLA